MFSTLCIFYFCIRSDVRLVLLPLTLPILHVVQDHFGSLVRRVLAAEGLNKITLGVHQVEVDAVVDEVVLARLDLGGSAEVDAVRLAHGLDLVVCARQADELGVELGQVLLEHLGGIARRIAGDEDRLESAGTLGLHLFEHGRHLVKLLGADVGAVAEAEVDLQESKGFGQRA